MVVKRSIRASLSSAAGVGKQSIADAATVHGFRARVPQHVPEQGGGRRCERGRGEWQGWAPPSVPTSPRFRGIATPGGMGTLTEEVVTYSRYSVCHRQRGRGLTSLFLGLGTTRLTDTHTVRKGNCG